MRKKYIWVSIVLICVILLVCISIPAISILGECWLVRWDIRNPYVNGGFRGWSHVDIENLGVFLIPKGWSLEKDSDIYWICDDTGDAWAFGAIMGSKESCFDNYKDLIVAACNIPCHKIEIDPFSRFSMMNGSDIDLLQVQGEMLDNQFFCIQMLIDGQREIAWIVIPDLLSNEDQYDIAEAIVYSYAFDVKKTR